MARKKAKKIVSSKVEKKEEKSKYLILFIAIAIVALVALFGIGVLNPAQLIGMPSENPNQGQAQQPATVTGDACSRNSECFLANCKSTPAVVECVNSVHQEIYFRNCNGYTDVNVVQNTARCYCNQRICTMVK